jgi:dihydrofolate reductase
VVSRDADFAAPGILVAASLDIALTLARADACRRGAEAVMIVGGAEIYAQALPVADRMEMTLVHMTAAGETRFPPVDPAEWQEVARAEQPAGPGDDSAVAFLRLVRRPPASAPPVA